MNMQETSSIVLLSRNTKKKKKKNKAHSVNFILVWKGNGLNTGWLRVSRSCVPLEGILMLCNRCDPSCRSLERDLRPYKELRCNETRSMMKSLIHEINGPGRSGNAAKAPALSAIHRLHFLEASTKFARWVAFSSCSVLRDFAPFSRICRRRSYGWPVGQPAFVWRARLWARRARTAAETPLLPPPNLRRNPTGKSSNTSPQTVPRIRRIWLL